MAFDSGIISNPIFSRENSPIPPAAAAAPVSTGSFNIRIIDLKTEGSGPLRVAPALPERNADFRTVSSFDSLSSLAASIDAFASPSSDSIGGSQSNSFIFGLSGGEIHDEQKEKIIDCLYNIFGFHCLDHNAHFRQGNVRDLGLVDYAAREGIEKLSLNIKLAPDLFLMSPQAFLCAVTHENTFKNFLAVLAIVKSTRNAFYQEGREKLDNFLVKVKRYNSGKVGVESIIRQSRYEVERMLKAEPFKIPQEQYLPFLGDFKDERYEFDEEKLSELEHIMFKRCNESYPHAPEVSFKKSFEACAEHYPEFCLLLANEACYNYSDFHLNYESILLKLMDKIRVAEWVSQIAKRKPHSFVEMESGESVNYISELRAVQTFIEEDEEAFLRPLFEHDHFNEKLLRTYVAIGRHLLTSPSLTHSHCGFKERNSLIGHASFVISIHPIRNVLIGDFLLGYGTTKKVSRMISAKDGKLLIKASAKGSNNVEKMYLEKKVIDELQQENCINIVTPYHEAITFISRSGVPKIVLTSHCLEGTGEDLVEYLPSVIANVLGDVGHALSVLHKRGVVYHDLNPSNFLITNHGGRVIGVLHDFDLIAFDGTKTAMGTVGFAPPEHKVHEYKEAKEIEDSWRYGMTALCIILGGYAVFDPIMHLLDRAKSAKDVQTALLQADIIIQEIDETESEKNLRYSHLAVITGLLSYDPASRWKVSKARDMFYKIGSKTGSAFSLFSFKE